MDKSVDTVDDLCESAEGGDSSYYLTNLIVSLKDLPRIFGILLVYERYLAGFGVDVLDANFDLVADGYYVGRMLYSLPAEVELANKSVYSAEVYEYAVIGDSLSSSG